MNIPRFLRRWVVPADELAVALASEQEKASQIPPLRNRAEDAEERIKNLTALLDTARVIRARAGFVGAGFGVNTYTRHLRIDVAIDERMLTFATDPHVVRNALASQAAYDVKSAVLTLDFMLAKDIAGEPR